jgi:hypothetical protein
MLHLVGPWLQSVQWASVQCAVGGTAGRRWQVCGWVQYEAGCGGGAGTGAAAGVSGAEGEASCGEERCRAAVACNVCKGRARLGIGMRAGLSHHLQLSHAVEPRVGQSAIVEHKGAGAGWGPLDTSSRGTVTGGAGAHAG